MTGGARDVSRIIDKLANRVDRLENRGSTDSQVSTTMSVDELAGTSDAVETNTDEADVAAWGAARWDLDGPE